MLLPAIQSIYKDFEGNELRGTPVFASDTEYHVSPNFPTISGICSSTIQQAIDDWHSVDNNKTIIVHPGIYNEQPVIDGKDLRIHFVSGAVINFTDSPPDPTHSAQMQIKDCSPIISGELVVDAVNNSGAVIGLVITGDAAPSIEMDEIKNTLANATGLLLLDVIQSSSSDIYVKMRHLDSFQATFETSSTILGDVHVMADQIQKLDFPKAIAFSLYCTADWIGTISSTLGTAQAIINTKEFDLIDISSGTFDIIGARCSRSDADPVVIDGDCRLRLKNCFLRTTDPTYYPISGGLTLTDTDLIMDSCTLISAANDCMILQSPLIYYNYSSITNKPSPGFGTGVPFGIANDINVI